MAGMAQSEPPGRRINGHRLTRELSAGDITAPEVVAPGTDQDTTRYLSAATQLDIDFARGAVRAVRTRARRDRRNGTPFKAC
jgi:hypothetical protein